ncbi:lytic transglycosylase domain-containing protein [Desulfolutivibrio sulfoxidireducens]|uniref:lytic transglycosylase domain-containing protein n=1 Tax=Desulfolutivibrio sulfoxidireducens TaxID=2773299 RepID=UPI001FE290CA|nr:lytic transglycosylase domain-containing protein [Desulfolutivibrio sulfoxidireducens]QLA14960.1 transglycosylase SLT domain-containing protein [Desulfolutivibrio sulfoxidireducens]QLA18527.1 transglycosylase SLT domain-containing protein [Desulfolutivibrio sulfoxidireducens]
MSIPSTSARPSRAFGLVAVLVVALWPCASAKAYTLYGFEDEFGIVHLSETRTSERDVLLFEGPADPKLGFVEIKRRIREKGGAAKARRQDWIADAVKPYGAAFQGTGGPHAFGPVITSGPLVDMIRRHGATHRVPLELLYAVVEQESGFQNAAVSPKGAQGLMQLMPDTQATLGVADPFDPEKNIAAGARFLRMMLDRFRDTPLALAAYNAGPEVVARSGGVPPIPETLRYVERVMARQAMLQGVFDQGEKKNAKPVSLTPRTSGGSTPRPGPSSGSPPR